MAESLIHSGHGGVTFSIRPDIRYGIRPSPFYEFYGSKEKLHVIYNHLFRCGVTSSLHSDRLQVAGVRNCLMLSDILELNNTWSWALQHIFAKGRHKHPNGIRTLFFLFGDNSTIQKETVDRVIRDRVDGRLQRQLRRFAEDPSAMKLLPEYDQLYKKYPTDQLLCDKCGTPGVKIYFIGEYPRPNNIFFLCPRCRP